MLDLGWSFSSSIVTSLISLIVLAFLVSLVSVLVVQGFWLLGTQAIDLLGTEAIVMPMIVITTSIFLFFYSKGAKQNNWLT